MIPLLFRKINMFDFYYFIYDQFMRAFSLYKTEAVLLAFDNNGFLIDLAGGTGYLAEKLSKQFKEIIVADSSPKMLRIAKRRGLNTKIEDALNLSFDDCSFDSLLCSDALHHIKDLDRVVSEIARILTDDGEAVIVEFHIKGLFGWLFYIFEKVWIDNSKFIAPDQLVTIMEKYEIYGDIIYLSPLIYMYKGKKIRGEDD